MAGHKVKCQCGFVFRLGAKKDKQPGVAEDLKRKRAIRERKAASRNALALADQDESEFATDMGSPLYASADRPKNKRYRRAGQTLKSDSGPIVSLIVSAISLLAMLVVVAITVLSLMKQLDSSNQFLSSSSGARLLGFISNGALLLVSLLLTCSIVASGITAAMELKQGRLIVWAHRLSAILATVFMFLLLTILIVNIVMLFTAFNRLSGTGRVFGFTQTIMNRAIFQLILVTIIMSIAPLAVAITGFLRR